MLCNLFKKKNPKKTDKIENPFQQIIDEEVKHKKEKIALVIGINEYDKKIFGDNDLKGCLKDNENVQKILKQKEFSCTTLQNNIATKQTILKNLEYIKDTLKNGDVFVFNISSHGTYKDENGERKTGIVCYDNIIWDYEIKKILSQIAEGVKVVWITDCCHAEDNFKFMRVSAKDYLQKRFLDLDEEQVKSLRLVDNTEFGVNVDAQQFKIKDFKCELYAFSSSSKYQPSYDLGADKGGVFTATIVEVLDTFFKITTKDVSYYQVFDGIERLITKYQLPQTPKFVCVNGNPSDKFLE